MGAVSVNGMFPYCLSVIERSDIMTVYYKDKTLPNRFKECRIKAGLTQPELTLALGFKGGKATVGCYERNLRLPNVPTLIKMKDIFSVSLDYLLCLDDYPTHIDYAKNKLGLDDELLEMLVDIVDNIELTRKVNLYIQHDLRKEIMTYEKQTNQ